MGKGEEMNSTTKRGWERQREEYSPRRGTKESFDLSLQVPSSFFSLMLLLSSIFVLNFSPKLNLMSYFFLFITLRWVRFG